MNIAWEFQRNKWNIFFLMNIYVSEGERILKLQNPPLHFDIGFEIQNTTPTKF